MFLLLPHAAIVKNIKTKTLSATAVRVSWKNVVIPEITGYIIVYYTWDGIRQNVSVNSSVNSVDIEGLLENVKYHFQVAVLAEVDGGEFIGELALELQELGTNNVSSNDVILNYDYQVHAQGIVKLSSV